MTCPAWFGVIQRSCIGCVYLNRERVGGTQVIGSVGNRRVEATPELLEDSIGDTPTGAVEVAACDTEGCRILTVDSSADIYQPADGSWSTWRVSVRGVNVQVERNGVTVMNTAVPELARSGLGSVGVYSNDNDGGVFYDNFCAWRLE